MYHERWRVPDRVFWVLSIIINILTWGTLIYFYDGLPSIIPTHFGLNGQADSFGTKSFWLVFLPAMIQLGETLLFSWIYRHPQYSNIPSSMTLVLLPEPWKSRIIHVLRHLLVMVTVISNLIFAYIGLAVVSIALGLSVGLSGWIIAGLVGLLLFLIAVYGVWLFRWSKQAVVAAQASAHT